MSFNNLKTGKPKHNFFKHFNFKKDAALFLLATVGLFVIIALIYSGVVAARVAACNGISIVLDAGHGGRDGGSVGKAGTIEKEINLKYTLALKDKLVKAGYRVELTRKTDDGLYSPTAKNKKQSDMAARFNIIKKANPSLVVSLHMNSFPNSSAHGATTYYRKNDAASQNIANLIQKSLNTYLNSPNTAAKVGDFYILNCSYYTAVLVECGFLSNPEEERLLNTNEYMQNLTQAIFAAILLYFG